MRKKVLGGDGSRQISPYLQCEFIWYTFSAKLTLGSHRFAPGVIWQVALESLQREVPTLRETVAKWNFVSRYRRLKNTLWLHDAFRRKSDRMRSVREGRTLEKVVYGRARRDSVIGNERSLDVCTILEG